MSDIHIPNLLLYGELAEGKHTQGGQKKHFKDTVKVSLKSFGIDPDSWEILAKLYQQRHYLLRAEQDCRGTEEASAAQIHSQLFANQPSRPLLPDVRQSFPSPHLTDQPKPDTPYPVNLLSVMSLVIVDSDG
ncbi:hypothetical protein NDU88_001986 [Pleurodeles waltl]|uniref:Uncharacterized protein n=1 Tax=Pleurodeles waltl TaxID=8319 RepID=A0AAV7Q7M3_PLEWA|nr:hypothetical protein NDU88_001986 [Pleurodeles waltl]